MNLIDFSNKIHSQSELFAEVVNVCKALFHYSPLAKEARDYMRFRMSEDSINKYHIGYFPDNENLGELYERINKDILKELRLVYTKVIPKRGYLEEEDKGLFHYNNIVFPFFDEYGNIIALTGRTLFSESEQKELGISKYKNTFFNKSLHLFGLNKAKHAISKTNCAIVVEGQIDCISCHENGYYNTVSITGSSLSRYQVYLLKKMTNKIYLLFDNDDAGELAFHKAYKAYCSDINIERLQIPKIYKDIDEYLHKSDKYNLYNYRQGLPITKVENSMKFKT